MKIEGINSNGVVGNSQPRTGSPDRPRAAAAAQDSVAIGTAARLASGGEAPLDTARVQQIRQAIAEGRFRINPEAIADRLIESARELVDGQRQA